METSPIRVLFVIPEKNEDIQDCSEDMQQAHEVCRQNLMKIEFIKEPMCLKIELKKTDVMVFETFTGTAFKQVQKSKAVRIVGPGCVLRCLLDGQPIPNLSWPIYTVAMNNCIVTCSGLPKEVKRELKQKIEYMAAVFTVNLMDRNTHLVTDSVKSEKYIKAAQAGVKLMLPSWVEAVWNSNCNVHCDDVQFETHRCPPFHNLVICKTGFTKEHGIESKIENNGGIFRGQLNVRKTDVLICDGPGSAKYKAARKTSTIKCVTYGWLTDSIKAGYALPESSYHVKPTTSTPTKEDQNFSIVSSHNYSAISSIASSSQVVEVVDETAVTFPQTTTPVGVPPRNKRKSSSDEHNDLVDAINLSKVKSAGSFLDGCSVYIAGFGTEQREKLCKLLNFSGATRYDNITDRITHIIIGDTTCHDVKLMRSKGLFNNCPLVNINWLLESIEEQQPVSEEKYIISIAPPTDNEAFSPLSKKSLQLLRKETPAKSVEAKTTVPVQQGEADADILQQYLQPNISSQEDTLAKFIQDGDLNFESKHENTLVPQNSIQAQPNQPKDASKNHTDSVSTAADGSSQIEPIFEGLTFVLVGFTEEDVLKETIIACSGQVVSQMFKGVPDFAVVPVFSSSLKQTASNIVTDMWILECVNESCLADIQYYHQPLPIQADREPLKNCVVTVSSYINYERNFLKYLTGKLGAIFQEQLARTDCGDILASTHLVSPVAAGKKYLAAVKWGLPVITKNWLLECARMGRLLPVDSYLVENAKEQTSITENKISFSSLVTNSAQSNSNTSQCTAPQTTNQKNTSQHTIPGNQALPFGIAGSSKNPDVSHFDTPKSDGSARISNNTPSNQNLVKTNTAECTPVNRIVQNVEYSPCSQVTPVNKIMERIRENNMLGAAETPPLPKPYGYIATPETPLGAFICPNPSRSLRKEMQRYINALPEWKPSPVRRLSTPMSELKRRLWDKLLHRDEVPSQPDFGVEEDGSDEVCITPTKTQANEAEQMLINKQLDELQEMVTTSGGSRLVRRQSTIPAPACEIKDSQVCSVGWDYAMQTDQVPEPKPKNTVPTFMLSGIDHETREEMIDQLVSLGAVVTQLSSYDPKSTHLICPKPLRNEKILGCIAAGKWILHTSYVEKSVAAGKLLDEEEFEYGNPNANESLLELVTEENETRMRVMHWWRKEITKRGYGAFHDMKAIVVATKKDQLINVIEAGGGMVVDHKPPFNDVVHATHCLLEVKSIKNFADYIPLAKQGIFCVNTLYINDFLQKSITDIKDCILPYFSKFSEFD